MSATLKLSALDGLSDAERQKQLEEFVKSRHDLNGHSQNLNERIAEYETRYEMSSETFRRTVQ